MTTDSSSDASLIRWVLPVAPYESEAAGDCNPAFGPRLAELTPYATLLKAVSQRVARFNEQCLCDGDSTRGSERWRVVADPPLCVLLADDNCHGYHAHGHLRFGFPLFFGGAADPPDTAEELHNRGILAIPPRLDPPAQQLLEVLRATQFPAETCRRRWKVGCAAP